MILVIFFPYEFNRNQHQINGYLHYRSRAMTHIVVLPSLLPELLPKASANSPKHIRLFCQILSYEPSRFMLTVGKVPMLSNVDNDPIDINVKELLATLTSSLSFEVGDVIEIDGCFNGRKVEPISICEMQWLDVTIEKLQVLDYMSDMKPL